MRISKKGTSLQEARNLKLYSVNQFLNLYILWRKLKQKTRTFLRGSPIYSCFLFNSRLTANCKN